MLDVSSKECERLLRDRYRLIRGVATENSASSASDTEKSQNLRFSPVQVDYFFDDARIVSTVADWAVVDVEKPVIT